MSKKTWVAAAVALVVAGYGAGTWYSGEQAQKAFADAAAELRHAVGKEATVTESYEKGFFSSQAKWVLEWTPPAPKVDAPEHDGDEVEPAPAAATPATPPKSMRLVMNSDIRHGPLAGGKLAAAVVESRFALEGLDAEAKQPFAKASMPTVTGVRHYSGSSDWRFALPAGEAADKGVTVRWADMAYDVSMASDQKTIRGEFKWPELVIAGLPKSAADDELQQDLELEDDDTEAAEEAKAAVAAAAAAQAAEQLTIAVKGMGGSFNTVMIDGLWGVGPGKMQMQAASAQVINQKADGQPETVAEFKDITADTTMEADAKTLSISNHVKSVGRIGPLAFESLGYEEKIQRLDLDALRSFQQMLLEGYRQGGLAKALEPSEEQMAALMEKSAPQLVAALPAYQMKLKASYQGNAGEVAYGAEVLKAPSAEQVAETGWMPALLKGSALNASARLPKAWLANIAKASGQEMGPEEIDAMVEMATGTGYARVEGDFLTSNLQVKDGKMNLNGVVKPLPMGFGE